MYILYNSLLDYVAIKCDLCTMATKYCKSTSYIIICNNKYRIARKLYGS